MIEPPTTWEWLFIYAPIGGALVGACIYELLTGLISKWLSLAVLLYLLGVRLAENPQQIGWRLLSLLVGIIVIFAFGWGRGYLGGGVAKLAVAICVGLPVWMAACASCGLVLLAVAFERTYKWHRVERLPGSIVLAVVLTAIVGAAKLLG